MYLLCDLRQITCMFCKMGGEEIKQNAGGEREREIQPGIKTQHHTATHHRITGVLPGIRAVIRKGKGQRGNQMKGMKEGDCVTDSTPILLIQDHFMYVHPVQ